MKNIPSKKYPVISFLSVVVGGTSLLMFAHFVVFGPFGFLDFKLSNSSALLLNFALSCAFFLQHSLMIRGLVRKRIESLFPTESFYAIYSIFSGILIYIVVLFWQKTDLLIFAVPPPYKYLLYSGTILAVAGLVWATMSLKEFDPFGRKQISNFLKSRMPKKPPFVLSGPFKITRHPFYFFTLLMMWSYPVVTADRLLFSGIWTIWIIIGTVLEEKDLVRTIGDKYSQYQTEVPMLIPYKCSRYFT